MWMGWLGLGIFLWFWVRWLPKVSVRGGADGCGWDGWRVGRGGSCVHVFLHEMTRSGWLVGGLGLVGRDVDFVSRTGLKRIVAWIVL